MDPQDKKELMFIREALKSADVYGLTTEVIFFAMEYYRNQKEPDKCKALNDALQEWDL